MALAAAVRVSAAENTDKLFDAVKWHHQQKLINTKEAKALVNLVTIKYDENVNRPWGDWNLRQETLKRWQNFRESFCPAAGDICLLSEEAQLSSISNVLKQEETLKRINTRLNELGSPLSIVRLESVPALLPADLSNLNDFNFIIGVISKEKSPDGQVYSRVTDTLLMDVGSYYLGYQRQAPAVYFAVDRSNQVLVFDETLIAKALELASVWQKSVVQEIPDGFLYLPNRLIRDYALSKKNNSPKYQGLQNVNGLEWFVYDEAKALAVNQALYMRNSWDEGLDDLTKEMLVRRSLLQLQKDFDQRLISLLYMQQSFDQNALVIQQYTPLPTVNTVIRENINALLSAEGFRRLPYKSQWFESADLKYIQDEAFLKEFNLDVYEAVEATSLLRKDWSTLNAEQKRSLAIAAIYPKNLGYADEIKNADTLVRTKTVDSTYINKPGMYRVFATIAHSKDLSLLSRLADEIYDKRFAGL